jgi:hypothetical protein
VYTRNQILFLSPATPRVENLLRSQPASPLVLSQADFGRLFAPFPGLGLILFLSWVSISAFCFLVSYGDGEREDSLWGSNV